MNEDDGQPNQERTILEVEKLRVETEKINCEMEEIRQNTAAAKAGVRRGQWNLWATCSGLVITFLFGMPVALLQSCEYLAQRQKQHEFAVSQEMIKLVEHLNQDLSPALQRSAAIGLSLIGKPAIPILVSAAPSESL